VEKRKMVRSEKGGGGGGEFVIAALRRLCLEVYFLLQNIRE